MRLARTPLSGFVAAVLCGATTLAAGAQTTLIVPDVSSVKWVPAPTSLPAGTQIVLLSGDPSQPGPFVLRLKFPPNTTIAPHRHATAENVTVLSGAFYHEVGDKIDTSRGDLVGAGGFVYLPAMTPHSLWTKNVETIIQVTGTGPFGLLYVDPADDPSKAATH
jgi:quercetin dioxygenase-like cupin family protein